MEDARYEIEEKKRSPIPQKLPRHSFGPIFSKKSETRTHTAQGHSSADNTVPQSPVNNIYAEEEKQWQEQSLFIAQTKTVFGELKDEIQQLEGVLGRKDREKKKFEEEIAARDAREKTFRQHVKYVFLAIEAALGQSKPQDARDATSAQQVGSEEWLTSIISRMVKNASSMNEQCLALKRGEAEAKKSIASLQAEIQYAKTASNSTAKRQAALRTENAALSAQNATLLSQVESARCQLQSATSHFERSEQERDSERAATLAALKETKLAVVKQRQKYEALVTQAHEELQEKVAAKSREISVLNRQVSRLSSKLDNSAQNVEELEAALADAKAELIVQKATHQESRAELESRLKEAQEVRERLEATEDQKKRHRELLSDVSAKLAAINGDGRRSIFIPTSAEW